MTDHDLLIETNVGVKQLVKTVDHWNEFGLPLCGERKVQIENLKEDVKSLQGTQKKWSLAFGLTILAAIVKMFWPET